MHSRARFFSPHLSESVQLHDDVRPQCSGAAATSLRGRVEGDGVDVLHVETEAVRRYRVPSHRVLGSARSHSDAATLGPLESVKDVVRSQRHDEASNESSRETRDIIEQELVAFVVVGPAAAAHDATLVTRQFQIPLFFEREPNRKAFYRVLEASARCSFRLGVADTEPRRQRRLECSGQRRGALFGQDFDCLEHLAG